jgi:prepilin-type N-terminal cleavage/methylation domain-containing protein
LRRPSRGHSRWFARRDAGFTLTELVIAMLVVGVLASIALPSFLGSRNNSYDKEAQASIQAILRAANLVYQSQGDFSDGSSAGCGTDAGSATSLAADLQRLEPGVDVVGGSVSSSNSRVVSVDARPTFNSNGEKLGCQGFYAVAFSSSGICWAARFISEGKYLGSGSVSPVVANGQTNTSNSAITTWAALAVNGNAFGVLKPQSSAADGDDSNAMASIQTACKARTQSTGATSLSTNYIAPSQFYASWRDAVAAPTQPAPTCANGRGTCVLGDTGPGGGIVFYVQAGGGSFTSTGSDCGTACKYLEAATSDLPDSTSANYTPWGINSIGACFTSGGGISNESCTQGSIYPGDVAAQSASATAAEAIGMGMANTNQIYARLTTVGGAATTAYSAGRAWAYSNNGKTDWHLPSKLELNELFNERTRFPGSGFGANGFVVGVFLHSSTEVSGSISAFRAQRFLDGAVGNNGKGGSAPVRAVRAFGPTD